MTVVYASGGLDFRRQHTSRTASGPALQKTSMTRSSRGPSTRPACARVRMPYSYSRTLLWSIVDFARGKPTRAQSGPRRRPLLKDPPGLALRRGEILLERRLELPAMALPCFLLVERDSPQLAGTRSIGGLRQSVRATAANKTVDEQLVELGEGLRHRQAA